MMVEKGENLQDEHRCGSVKSISLNLHDLPVKIYF